MIDALADSSIRFVTTRDERGAAFMADTYGALTGTPGVCLATLGPGAINLMLGIANAQLDSHPLVAITAQAALDRIYKESHQFVDLVSLYRPITKWGDMVTVAASAARRWCARRSSRPPPSARAPRSSSCPRTWPSGPLNALPLKVNTPVDPSPDQDQVQRAAQVLSQARHPVVLAGPGVARDGATDALIRFCERLNLPVATTFLGKGVFPDDHRNAVGTLGFMVKDYANFGFDTRRRRSGGGLRPGGVLAGPLEPAWPTSRSSTSIARSPRSTRTTRWRWACRATSPRPWTRLGALVLPRRYPGQDPTRARHGPRGARPRCGRRPASPWRRRASWRTCARRWAATTSCCATRAR